MISSTETILTVLGPIAPETLGHTQTHEHLLSDLSPVIDRTRLRGISEDHSIAAVTDKLEFTATERSLINQPIGLQNYDWIRRNVLNIDNLQLLNVSDAIQSMQAYRCAGGGAIVEATPIGLGRDPRGLKQIAIATGVNIIMGAGYYTAEYHPPALARLSKGAITQTIVDEFANGVGDTGIHPGIIGEIGLSHPLNQREELVLRAACKAQQITGAALQIHPGRHTSSPRDAMRVIAEEGVDPSRVIMAHIDRTLVEISDVLDLARTGCYLEYDLFGQESSYYAFDPSIDRPNDAGRITALTILAERGHADRIVISQDICQKVYLRDYGGPGYQHILENVLPEMRRKGWSDEEIHQVTHVNPMRFLTIQA